MARCSVLRGIEREDGKHLERERRDENRRSASLRRDGDDGKSGRMRKYDEREAFAGKGVRWWWRSGAQREDEDEDENDNGRDMKRGGRREPEGSRDDIRFTRYTYEEGERKARRKMMETEGEKGWSREEWMR